MTVPVTSVNRVTRLKPGAASLLEGTAGRTRQPVLAYQRYGRGLSVAMPIQDSFLWYMDARVPVEDVAYKTLWRQLLRWLTSDTPDLLRVAAQSGLPFLPGVATVSEAMRAREVGFPVLKLFPAEAVGGTALLKSIAGPFAALRFCPTGGIDGRNLRSYLDLPNVVAVGGSWMAPASDIADGAWDRITERARDAFRLARLTEMSAG